MSKHRRNTLYRKIATAAAVLAAMAIPSAAIACGGWQDGERGGAHDRWERKSEHRWSHHRWSQRRWNGDWAGRTATPAPSKTPSKAPAKQPAPASSTASPGGTTATNRVVSLVNSERSKAGCAPVTVNAKLTKAAQAHSADMASHRNMSHTGSDGSSPGTRIARAGYHAGGWGENVAYGYRTPEQVMHAWMTSPGHRRNILDCQFKEIGVGLAQPGYYWTQDFASAG